jgi:K+-transporting ATPase KdpF subunit
MKLKDLTSDFTIMSAALAVPASVTAESNKVSYIIGAVIALFIFGYLIYSLMKPDKF